MKSVGDMEMITFFKAPFTPFKVYRMSKLLFPIHSFDPLFRNILWNRRLFRGKKEIWYFLCFVKTQKKARFPWSIIFLFFQPFSFQSYAHSSWFLDGIHVITHRHSLFLSQFLRKKNCFLSFEEGKTGLCVYGCKFNFKGLWLIFNAVANVLFKSPQCSSLPLLFSVILISVKERIRD